MSAYLPLPLPHSSIMDLNSSTPFFPSLCAPLFVSQLQSGHLIPCILGGLKSPPSPLFTTGTPQ